MRNTRPSLDSSHFPKRNEILLFIGTFLICLIIDFINFPVDNYIKTSESFQFNDNEKRASSMYSLKPISFLQRFLIIELIIVPKSKLFSPINITTTSHLRTPNSIYNFQINYLLNMNQSQKIILFKKHSLINSILSMNLIFEGNLNEFSHYLIKIIHGKEIFVRLLISTRFSFFLISIIALIYYNNTMNHHKSHHRFHHIRILLVVLIVCNFPYVVLLNYKASYFISYIDNFTFSFYPAFFLSFLFYFCFFMNRGIKLFYFIILNLIIYITHFNIKAFLLSQLSENKHLYSCTSVHVQNIVLFIHILIAYFIRYFKKYDSAPAIFAYTNIIVSIQILFSLLNLYFDWTKNIFIFEILSVQFFNLATYQLISMFIPNASSHVVNEQLYYVDDFLPGIGSKSM